MFISYSKLRKILNLFRAKPIEIYSHEDLVSNLYRRRMVNWLTTGGVLALPDYVACGTGKTEADTGDITDPLSAGYLDRNRWNNIRSANAAATIIPQNSRIEFTTVGTSDLLGITSGVRYNLENSEVKFATASVSNNYRVHMSIVLTQAIVTSPASEANGYFVYKQKSDSKWYILKRKSSTSYDLANGAFGSATGSLSIKIQGDIIYFYENDVLCYWEKYDLPNYDCFISLYVLSDATYQGMDYCSGFTLVQSDTTLARKVARGHDALINELGRMQFTTKEVRPEGSLRMSVQFPAYYYTGPWYEIGLFDAANIRDIVSKCDSDTGWTTDPDNVLQPEILDYREGSKALACIGPDIALRFQHTGLVPPAATGTEDDFSDGAIGAFWSALQVVNGVVTESGGKLNCNVPASGDIAGVVSATAHDLATGDLYVEVNNVNSAAQYLMVSKTKVTASDPYFQSNWYRVMRQKGGGNLFVVDRVVATTYSGRYSVGWATAAGSIGIRISGGTIYFYENGVMKYSEAYALDSTTVYIYVYAAGGAGTDSFDNFRTSLAPVYTEDTAWLQLYYYVSDLDLITGGGVAFEIGNNSSNYWRFTINKAGLTEGWKHYQWLLTDWDVKTGSPTLSLLPYYFCVFYLGSTLGTGFEDRIDDIRLFRRNGVMFARAEFPRGNTKGITETKQVIWNFKSSGEFIA